MQTLLKYAILFIKVEFKIVKTILLDVKNGGCFMGNKKGFTLLELLTVISIMIILAGIVMPALNRARLKAYQAKAKAQIAGLELALSMFESDVGYYPSTDGAYRTLPAELFTENPANWITDGLNQSSWIPQSLRTSGITTVNGWNGPYVEFKEKEVDSGYAIDPWASGFKYRSPGNNNRSFDLYSVGPDTKDHVSDGSSSDDIKSWVG
ncbi:type II secretion system protein GspG [bacterium]|nr:type II secretion system protein GspG [bacterium]